MPADPRTIENLAELVESSARLRRRSAFLHDTKPARSRVLDEALRHDLRHEFVSVGGVARPCGADRHLKEGACLGVGAPPLLDNARRFHRHVSFETALALATHRKPETYWDIIEGDNPRKSAVRTPSLNMSRLS